MVVIVAERQVAPSLPRADTSGRLIALDGLRGIAAFVVVLHHIYQIARGFIEPTVHAWAPGSLWWFISATPIKLLSAGTESVLVFFVLSGLVVPLPLLVKGARTWAGFFVARLFRLYLPVWASLVFAGIVIALVPHPATAVTQGSWVQRTNGTQASLGLLFSEAGLMRNSFSSNSVLWSLRWEIIFSITLPLFLLAALALRRFWIPAGIACIALTFVGKLTNIDALLYLPVFFLGCLIAVNIDTVRRWADRRNSRSPALGLLVFGASLLAIVTSWMLRPVIPAGTLASDALGCLTPAGAAGLVLCAIAVRPVRVGLSSRVPQWLGRVSFSLYLTHVPILVALAYLFGDRNWPLIALAGIPLSLVVAFGFYRLVEAPSHRLARRLGAAASAISFAARISLRARRVARLRAAQSA